MSRTTRRDLGDSICSKERDKQSMALAKNNNVCLSHQMQYLMYLSVYPSVYLFLPFFHSVYGVATQRDTSHLKTTMASAANNSSHQRTDKSIIPNDEINKKAV